MNFKNIKELLVESPEVVVDNSSFYIKRVPNTHKTDYIIRFKNNSFLDNKKIDVIKINNKNRNVIICFEDGSNKTDDITKLNVKDLIIKTAIMKAVKVSYEELNDTI